MDVKALKPTSAKLLLHLLVNGASAENLSALTALLDMDRKTLSAARQQLKDEHLVGDNFRITEEKFPILRKYSHPGVEILPTAVENLPGAIYVGTLDPFVDWSKVTPAEVSPRTQCAEADRRGEGQMEAVQGAFKSLFGVDIVGGAARQLLRLGGAEEVYDALEIAKGRNVQGNPFPYVKKVMESERAKQQTPSVAIGPTRPESADHSGEMLEYTEAAREWSRRAEAALRRKGLLDE